ncbi:MAG: CRTAC1 family protein [Gammaproteobacteria bacterium]|nr:CRTAC1 family protein [Gammaproteobacteria bacterium]
MGTGLAACSTEDGAPSQSEDAWFIEESSQRGITFEHNSGFRSIPLLPEINGSGVALADLNGDGWLDIYFVQSGSLYEEEAGQWHNELYFNMHNGKFEKASMTSGAGDSGYGMGVAAGDYDNDGDVDLYVTNVGRNVLLANDGTGSFRDVSAEAGVDDSSFGASATFQDFDQDGHLDLFVANYVDWTRNAEVECYEGGIRSYCPPARYDAPAANLIYKNNGDGTFSNSSEESGIGAEFGNSFGVVSADFNSDGLIDLYVANDRTPNELWINQGGFKFANLAESYGVAADGFGQVKAGMGVTTNDYDRDGDFDLLIVNLVGETDTFFRNDGTHFVDITNQTGLNTKTTRYTRWGVILQDFNNDGLLDLYVANGGVYPSDLRSGDIYAEQNILFDGLSDGSFVHARKGPGWMHTSRGCAVGDVDNDGGLDLVVVNRDAPPYLMLNSVEKRGNWLSLELRNQMGRSALGAVLSYAIGGQTHYSMVSRDGSFMSSSDARVHLGLGEEKLITELEVRWSNGQIEHLGDFAANQFLVLHQDED